MRIKKILEWFLPKSHHEPLSFRGDQESTYRHGSQLLKCPLSPSIVDESFLASLQLHGKIGR